MSDAIKVMVVEDDKMVADLNKEFVQSVSGFTVVKVAHSGNEALEFIAQNTVNLVVLDVYLPDMLGIDVLRDMRKSDYPADVLLITAANSSTMIEEAIRLGVFDYIMKPFNAARFSKSLDNYKEYRKSLMSGTVVNQGLVDSVVAGAHGKFALSEALPKGINAATMDLVKKAISTVKGEIDIGTICESLSISRITAYRYLEYLCQEGSIEKGLRYQKVGRPSTVYIHKNF